MAAIRRHAFRARHLVIDPDLRTRSFGRGACMVAELKHNEGLFSEFSPRWQNDRVLGMVTLLCALREKTLY